MTTSEGLVALDEPEGLDPSVVGQKAAALAHLVAAGHPVPPGVAVPVSIAAGLDASRARTLAAEIVQALGEGPLAVRSSAIAEDGADASYAGMYDTVLGVQGTEHLASALLEVQASGLADRVQAYGPADHHAGMAILVQHQVEATSAGVAFTADPVTGDRSTVAVTATPGIGEALVSGEVDGEEWAVRGREARVRARGSATKVLDADQALAVADLAVAVAAGAEGPRDIEWAHDGTQLWVLQSRPMTALPEPASWSTTTKGWWRRDFRFAEWLPEPVTPLFGSWWFPRQEAGFRACIAREWNMDVRGPFHVLVNGWCYCSLGQMGPAALGAVVRHPVRMGRWIAAQATIGKKPALGERAMALPARAVYEGELLPAHRRAVADAASKVEQAGPDELVAMVDRLAEQVGWLTYPLVETLGYAGKAEIALAALVHEHLAGTIDGHLPLLAGLRPPAPPAPHGVSSLDWYRPTLGELQLDATPPGAARHQELVATRQRAEATARAALADRPKLLARFDEFLDIAQRYAVVREEMASDLTLAWPTLRRAIERLGEHLAGQQAIDRPDDVHFLLHQELADVLAGHTVVGLGERVVERRATWGRQRLLSPPVEVGTASPIHKRVAAAVELLRTAEASPSDTCLVGTPASAGRVTGVVRVVRSVAEANRVGEGEILVAPATAPAWTPLFAHIAAVVTDSGSAAAHASVIAREYGIPAVVGTHDATARLADGDVVIVDGSRGTVELVGAAGGAG